MSTLDEKLRDILTEQDNFAPTLMMIPAIKQVFADEGYVQIPTVRKEIQKGLTVNGKIVMTGQEWMSRFTKELKPLADGRDTLKWSEVRNAAWKAAGLE